MPVSRYSRHAAAGFTLVEMAIVIAIAGLILTFVVNSYGTQTQVRRETQTRDKMETIGRTLGNFLIAQGRTPCPADPAIAQTNATFGDQRAACATAALAEGLVPFRTLGLPVEMARDGWGRFITYRTSPTVTTTPDKASACNAVRVPANDVQVNDQNANNVVTGTAPPNSFNVHAVVLVSHGSNGVGAFVADGTATRQAGTAADANETTNLTTGSANKISGISTAGGYDDITYWRTVPVLVTAFSQTCP